MNDREKFEATVWPILFRHFAGTRPDGKTILTDNLQIHSFAKEIYQAAHAESAARIAELEKDAARLKQFTVWADSGLCPALVFNDNGYWAISFDGVIPMDFSEPPNDAQLLIDVEKSMWRETVAEAIDQAITNTGDKV